MTLCRNIGARVSLKYLGVAACIVGLHAVSAARVDAAVVSYGSNAYEFVEVADPYGGSVPYPGSNNSWFTARDAAAASTFNGVNGHLATVTTQAENDFLFSLVDGGFTGFQGAWLGGKEPEGWLVGPDTGPFGSYINWRVNEPNNTGYAYMSIGTTHDPGQWLDDSLAQNFQQTTWGQGYPDLDHDPVIGYFVEYEGAAVVPVPAAAWLFGSGLLGFVGMARRKQSI